MDKQDFIAHIRDREPRFQSLEDHLLGTAELSGKFAASAGMEKTGYILGLLHDVGKYGQGFQQYIRQDDSFTEQENAGEENNIGRGSIDHSTAGAQYIQSKFKSLKKASELIIKGILCLAICGHHGGLMDVISTDGTDNLKKRLEKECSKTYFKDVLEYLPNEIAEKIKSGFSESVSENFSFCKDLEKIAKNEGKDGCEDRLSFYIGCLTKFLFSCLVDADRCDTINFCVSGAQEARDTAAIVDWDILYKRLIRYLSSIKQKNGENPMSDLNMIREKISESAEESAQRGRGLFTFTVPTGGGKTLASLRFALQLARLHKKDKNPVQRIIYVLPYTTIDNRTERRARARYFRTGRRDWKNSLRMSFKSIRRKRDMDR